MDQKYGREGSSSQGILVQIIQSKNGVFRAQEKGVVI